jgi:circadian clock protein KaiB
MDEREIRDATEAFDAAIDKEGTQQYVLRLFVAGMTPRSSRAIDAIKKLCDDELKGRYDLEVVDIYQQPDITKQEQILAVPMLIKKLPLPLRKIIGDMSDVERVLIGLDLRPKKA